MLLEQRLGRLIQQGDLTVIDHAGRRTRCGDGTGGPMVVRLHARQLPLRALIDGELALPEAFPAWAAFWAAGAGEVDDEAT